MSVPMVPSRRLIIIASHCLSPDGRVFPTQQRSSCLLRARDMGLGGGFCACVYVCVCVLSLTRFLRAISVRQSKGSHSQIRLTLLLSSIYSSHYIASLTCSPLMLLLPILRVSIFIWFLSLAKIKHAVSL